VPPGRARRRGPAGAGPGRPQGRLPGVRRDPAGAEDDVRPHRRGAGDDPVPGAEDARLPALSRPPQAPPLRGHRPREVRRLLALRRGVPRRLHSRGGRRERSRQPGLRRRALRGGLRDQHDPLHLLRLLRGRLPVRRDHDGPRLRARRLQPRRPDLHQGDADGRAGRAHAAEAGRRVIQVCFFVAAIGALGGAIAVVALRNPFYSVLALVVHLVSLAALFLLLHAQFVAAAQVVVYAGAVMVLYVFVAAYVGQTEEPLYEPIAGQRVLAPLLGIALFVELSIAILGTALSSLSSRGPNVSDSFGTPTSIGNLFLERF